jgi:oligopeptide transport system substrate-binding protein
VRAPRLAVSLAAAFLAVGLAGGCTLPALSAQRSPQVLRLNLPTEPNTLDPNLQQYSYEATVSRLLFEPLVRARADSTDVEPAAAESWRVSPDGTVWTFQLDSRGTWTDGRRVVAQDFVTALKRILDPTNAAPYADPYFATTIAGAEAYARVNWRDPAAVRAFLDGLRVGALDERTLEVRLQRATPYFKWIAALWVWSPVRADIVQRFGADRWAQGPHSLVSNGQFRVREIVSKERISLDANPTYRARPRLDRIDLLQLSDPAADLARYRSGGEDVNSVDATNTQAVERDAALRRQLLTTTGAPSLFWIDFNTRRPPFSNAQVRLAAARAIDRDRLAADAAAHRVLPWANLLPRGVPGARADAETAQDFDPRGARDALAAAGVTPESIHGKIHFLVRSNAPTPTKAISDYIAEQLRTNLGVAVDEEVIDGAAVTERLKRHDYDIYGPVGWTADYPDPQDFFDLMLTGSGNNFGGWSDGGYDRLVQLADFETDAAKRAALYAQAHHVVVQQAPVAFLYQRVNWYLVKPWVANLELTPSDDPEFPGDQRAGRISIRDH